MSGGREPADLVVPPGATWQELGPSLRALLHGEPGAPEAVVLATSGSSGTPKRVRLGASALRASGDATAQVLGGHGRWVLALPTHHVAGLQVLARSALAGTEPVAVATGDGASFTAERFAAAVADLRGSAGPRLASLVPTQLARLVADPSGVRALRGLDTVLVGGAAAEDDLLERARSTGVRVVTTYGMSETAGGCVYDGRPLPRVQVRLDQADGRIHLGGPVLAQGYVDAPALTADRFRQDGAQRWFVTDDRGRWQGDRLQVLGRVDDVIITGGHKVEPRDVERVLLALPGVGEALVVGVPDPEWGQAVGALLAPRAGSVTDPAPDLAQVRAALDGTLPTHARPQLLAWVASLPLLDSGKPDRVAARAALARARGSDRGPDGWQNGEPLSGPAGGAPR